MMVLPILYPNIMTELIYNLELANIDHNERVKKHLSTYPTFNFHNNDGSAPCNSNRALSSQRH